jgi:hypothetical protein
MLRLMAQLRPQSRTSLSGLLMARIQGIGACLPPQGLLLEAQCNLVPTGTVSFFRITLAMQLPLGDTCTQSQLQQKEHANEVVDDSELIQNDH